MTVVATAGHVDHGKSTLVRALTGTDPDRLAEERRRGLTIELGYAWTDLPDVGRVAFVDVPGHERFLATMLAGVGPVPAVLLVVAADEGWRRQTGEHVAALHALGVRHGLVAVTRSDLADPVPAAADVIRRLAGTSLAGSPAVAVSARTGAGLDDLRAALSTLVRGLPPPDPGARLRLPVDRVFPVAGAGTVVTGTLAAGALAVGDEVELAPSGVRAGVRSLESCRVPLAGVGAVARVAVGLRGVSRDRVARGDVVVRAGQWSAGPELDVALIAPAESSASGGAVPGGAAADPAEVPDRLSAELVLHLGASARPVRVRVLAGSGGRFARLRADQPVVAAPGDRGVLRDPGRHAVAAGVLVLDADPPTLRRTGSARARSTVLAGLAHDPAGAPGLAAAVTTRRFARPDDLARRGLAVPGPGSAPGSEVDPLPASVRRVSGWLVAAAAWEQSVAAVRRAVADAAERDPLAPGLPDAAAAAAAGLPDVALVPALVAEARLARTAGVVREPGGGSAVPAGLGPALAAVTAGLAADPFAAPDAERLRALGLGPRELAVLAGVGALLRLPGEVVLLPDALARAAALLRPLRQPFTVADARTALGTSRRVVVPLLEAADRARLTPPAARLDPGHDGPVTGNRSGGGPGGRAVRDADDEPEVVTIRSRFCNAPCRRHYALPVRV